MINDKHIRSKSWYVDINRVRTDYVIIQNLAQFKSELPPNLPKFHPEYVKFWSRETKKCIDGIYGREFGQYRFMPGNLYYFGNYGVLEHTWEDERGVKVTEDIKPLIVDYLWDFAYQSWVAYGFSGFEKDDLISCHYKLKLYEDNNLEKKDLPKSCISKSGKVKGYEDPYKYIRRLHEREMGLCLFENPNNNSLTAGSRGGTKSYWVAIAELEYNFVFGGARRYDKKFIDREYKCQQCVGASETDKSAELLSKFKYSLDAKTNAKNKKFKKWFGIWEETVIDHRGKPINLVTPCPFYKRSTGSLSPSNKDNLYTVAYKVDVNGEWIEKGEGSSIAHVNYSTRKGSGGSRAAEGGRYLFSDVEEVGSVENYIDVLGANEGTITRGGSRIGVQHSQGTSGNIEYVQAMKKVFLKPGNYFTLGYVNKFSPTPTGMFIPFYITMLQYKDKNGNTDYKKAIDDVNRQRELKASSDDPRVLRDFLMNKPCYIDEMWITNKGYYLPYEEPAEREKELMEYDLYKSLMTNVELYWDDKELNGVGQRILHDAAPYTDFPHDFAKQKDPSGNVVIYEPPVPDAPPDMYSLIGYDPYIEESIDHGGSVGVTMVLKNPKYITQGHTGNVIVATYIGKPIKGLDFYHGQQERLIQLYGNPERGLWFEKNRGEGCREYYIRKNKVNLLCLTPQRIQGTNVYQRDMMSYGFLVGNKISKLQQIKMLHDWLLEQTTFMVNGVEETKTNVARIPCIYTIRQIMQYNLEGNFDAIDALKGSVLGLRETENILNDNIRRTNRQNVFKGLLTNNKIFRTTKMLR